MAKKNVIFMGPGGTVTEDLSKFDDMVKRLIKGANGTTLQVGILKPEADIRYESGATMGEIAIYNEFGVPGRIPARPFLRPVVRGRKKAMRRIIRSSIQKRADIVNRPEKFIEVFLSAVGGALAFSVKENIRTKKKPKNSKETVRKKGFNDPLIGAKSKGVPSGLMRDSVSYKVKKKGM